MVEKNLVSSSISKRAFASILNLIIYGFISMFTIFLGPIAMLFLLGFYLFNEFYCEYNSGKNIGYRILGIKIVSTTGKDREFSKIFIRKFVYNIINFIPLGIFVLAFFAMNSETNSFFYDNLTNLRVVEDK